MGPVPGFAVMKFTRPFVASIVASLLGVTSGLASAHQDPLLVVHLHPHLGVEQLLPSVGLAAVVYWLARRIRGH